MIINNIDEFQQYLGSLFSSSCENLFKFMRDMNWYIKKAKFFQKKYYKNYYNIFNEALESKSQR